MKVTKKVVLLKAIPTTILHVIHLYASVSVKIPVFSHLIFTSTITVTEIAAINVSDCGARQGRGSLTLTWFPPLTLTRITAKLALSLVPNP